MLIKIRCLFSRICVFNNTRLIRYNSYTLDEMQFCTNAEYCRDTKRNLTIKCPLWKAYCGPIFDRQTGDSMLNDQMKNSLILDGKFDKFEDPVQQHHVYLCYYFQMNKSVVLRRAIPGLYSKAPISGKSS